MLNIILVGCCGRMGTAVTAAAKNADNIKIVAGVDVYDSGDRAYPVYGNIADANENADVIIDFSNPSSLSSVLTYSLKNNVPAVLCATGYSEEDIAAIRGASEKVAMFRSGNMSLGINVLSKLAKAAAEILGGSFDVEIVEAHHGNKLDAPSGTAIMLEHAVEEGLSYDPEIVYDRHDRIAKRPKNEIGMHSIRGGTIVGEHEIIFAGNDEIVRLSHTAMSRNIFADGALKAAEYLAGKAPGMYDMSDVING
ncbi:MAG: 4-hydroxy-tetrahydrodipicolinate reductase [Clostridia bacterium]|nr:4-hydroxy-tetrahydrodipicolinate reductase [Clostridia bacterium]